MVAYMLLASLLAITSVQAFKIVTRDMVAKETITETDLIKTAGNFIILFDTSGTTNEMVPGKTVIIMFTDGKVTRLRGTKTPLQITQEVARYSDVCFYLISSATKEMNAQMLASVSKVNACSRVVPIAACMDNPQYLSGALFVVRTTAYTRLKPMTQSVGVFVDDVLYDHDSSVVRSEYNDKLNELGDYFMENPDTFLVVGGCRGYG